MLNGCKCLSLFPIVTTPLTQTLLVLKLILAHYFLIKIQHSKFKISDIRPDFIDRPFNQLTSRPLAENQLIGANHLVGLRHDFNGLFHGAYLTNQ